MSFIQISTGVVGQNLYAVFYSHEKGYIWDDANDLYRDTTAASGSGNGELNYSTSWANVAVTLTEDEGSAANATGCYQLSVPSTLENQVESVDVVVRERAGGSPAVTDAVVAQGSHSPNPHTSYSVSQSR